MQKSVLTLRALYTCENPVSADLGKLKTLRSTELSDAKEVS